MPKTTLHQLHRIVREPVLAETRANLARSRARLPDELQTAHQMLGRQGNGCGATIGAMPRCDFACRGCYLGDGANSIPPAPVEAIKAQMRALRPTLGNAGNLQLTDGEVTLRPADEVIELLRYARELGLMPMLMTHGDSFRRQPGLLERLMVEGGLVEVSIHVDTTQRGRTGAAYKYADTERALNPLRDEFATMLRRARATTGLPLRAATTMTVTRQNLGGVADVMPWVLRNRDVFRMISFQPVAQVGRTDDAIAEGVDVEALWAEIGIGIYGERGGVERLTSGRTWLGHPDCNRFVHGVVAASRDGRVDFHPLRSSDRPADAAIADEFLRRFGGITFRRDSALERTARLLGVLLQAPGFVLGSLPRYAVSWLDRLGEGRPLRALAALATGRLQLGDLIVVSHHFMSRAELETPRGRERVDLCVFHVPIGDRLVSMCEVNATSIRDEYYEQILRDDLATSASSSSGAA
jgi:MoaA/NifB/PqqE/SkfB family radical SAM enzyme